MAYVEELFLKGDYAKASAEASALIDARASQRDELYYLKASSELKSSRFGTARQTFSELIEKYPRSKRAFDAYVGIGDAYFLEGDTARAARAYDEAAASFPSDKNIGIVWYRLGDCYSKLGAGDKAASLYAKARTAAPLSFEAGMSHPIPETPPALSDYQPRSNFTSRSAQDETAYQYFSVQAGCFKSKRNADQFARKLSVSGYDSYVEAPESAADRLFRVKVGRSLSKPAAEGLALRLKKDGYSTKICSVNSCQ